MVKNNLIKKYFLGNKIKFNFLQLNNYLYIFCNKLGVYLKLPNLLFFKNYKNNIRLIFLKKSHFFSVIKQIFNILNIVTKIFFFRIKLRGLGYRIKRINNQLYRFFFAYKHYFYFHIPLGVYIKSKKRRLIFLSNNLSRLNDVFKHLLYLKKMDFYEKSNTFIVPKKILYMKKRK